ncbi:hypothetical protein KAFR_0C04690 [Kazachstania africana CBS 2517]|uniref:ATP-dependent RNA helicase n=1 Tax=Kazachstania africana (strain ATCC 22294 / BCRC 22015 / CBS 2517 / CECT 1963 / NBRC 1671 / NRRL Y-8276) TaxID=1071382 RepID=H2ASW0_KAZAF|nr:hypothetical protein KAFR_0C04690 [Kazachstania africana CBS 2517]CCF57460.1 hypothetical protein KAFR_0C04690 [Kazachstania africana CBS 2517]
MFAQRFDPTKLAVVDSNEEKPIRKEESPLEKVIPLKRSNEVESEDKSEEEEEEEVYGLQEEEAENDIDMESGMSSYEEARIEEATEKTVSEPVTGKHDSVFSRFQQTISLQDRFKPDDLAQSDEDNMSEVEQRPLEQIPQPAIVRNLATNDNTSFSSDKSTAWMNSTKIYYDNSMIKPYDTYGSLLQPKLLQNIKKYFSQETFPIQTILLDTILPLINFSWSSTKKNFTRRVGDILVNASTGSGKTLAYSIPIIQTLSNRKINKLRCLIIVPTKMLIHQVFETLQKLSSGTSLVISTSKLENSLREEHSRLLQVEPDILIITPGRLVDLLSMKSISLKNLKFLVLDEADRLLNQSFQNWSEELLHSLNNDKSQVDTLPGNVVKMVFSATLTTNTEKLNTLRLYNPKLFLTQSVKLYNLPKKLQETNICIPTAKSLYKPLFLLHLLKKKVQESIDNKILIFVKSNEASLRLATLLSVMAEKFNSSTSLLINSINSNNTKSQNNKIVNEFGQNKGSSMHILITTDLMSRGIDINSITNVINYDLPISSQQYVHRVGRTARANMDGNAINLLVGKGERKFWNQQIDEDLSRDVDGHEVMALESDDPTNEIVVINEDEDSIYKECLFALKSQV